ncbi:MAG: TRM11 family SAM-dependent methyltransferase [Infirmifilum uzonense]
MRQLSPNIIEVSGLLDIVMLEEYVYRSATLQDVFLVIKHVDLSGCLDFMDLLCTKGTGIKVENPVIRVLSIDKLSKLPSITGSLTCLEDILSIADQLSFSKIYPYEGRPHLIINCLEKKGYLGVFLKRMRRDRFIYRSPEKRAFMQYSALSPRMALFMVNLSTRAKGREKPMTFLDPFCGSGGVLIEAALLGYYAVGLEIFYKPVRGARRNVIQLNLYTNVDLILADASLPPFREKSFDAIAFDPPYGRLSPVKGRESVDPLINFLSSVRYILKKNGSCIFLYPSGRETDRLTKMGFTEECKIFEHSRLTRSLWCLRDERQGHVLGS